jgi:hypothetical protein
MESSLIRRYLSRKQHQQGSDEHRPLEEEDSGKKEQQERGRRLDHKKIQHGDEEQSLLIGLVNCMWVYASTIAR